MRTLIFFVFLLLVLSLSAPVSGQTTSNKSQPPTNLRTPKEPVRSAAVILPSTPEREAEAKKLYEEGLKLSEAGELPQAAANFQRAVKLNAQFADAYSALGRTYFKMRQWQPAIDNLRRAAELHKEIQEARSKKSQNQTSLASNTAETSKLTQPQIKQSQANNTNGSANPPRPNPSATPKSVPPEIKQPIPNSNPGVAALRSNPSVQPERQQQTTIAAKTEKPQSKPQDPSANASSNALRSIPLPQPERQPQTTAPPKTATPQTKPPAANANAGANVVRQESKAAPKSELTQEVKQQAQAALAPTRSTAQQPETSRNSSQTNPPANSKAAGVQSHPTQKFEKAAVAPLTTDAGNGLSQVQQPTGERVAMNLTPSSQPLEANSVTPSPAKPPSDDIALTKIYRVGPNDVIDVRVNDSQSPKSTLFTITPAGLLEYPLLVEPLAATGLTVEEIGARIEEDLKKRALIENPKVTVGVRDYGSHTIIVSGLVKDAGTKFLMREAIPLYVVVADAQPLPEAAKVTLVRNELSQIFEVDLTRAADMNLLVRPGDVLTFQPNVTQFVYIGGEVKVPGEKTFRRGLTLTQAILTAGGVTPKATVAQIARDDGRGFLAETSFKLKEIASGKTVDPLLKPGDRISILR